MAKEKNLTNVTTVAAADFVRMVTSAGASVKGTMENLAKSLLTTAFSGLSLGGSQQSVKDALDSLNSKTSLTAVDPVEIASGINISRMFIRKECGIVIFNGFIENTSAFSNSETRIMTLPAGARPIDAIRTTCALALAAYLPPASMGYITVSSSGQVSVTAPAGNTNKIAYFSFSYMAQN